MGGLSVDFFNVVIYNGFFFLRFDDILIDILKEYLFEFLLECGIGVLSIFRLRFNDGFVCGCRSFRCVFIVVIDDFGIVVIFGFFVSFCVLVYMGVMSIEFFLCQVVFVEIVNSFLEVSGRRRDFFVLEQ